MGEKYESKWKKYNNNFYNIEFKINYIFAYYKVDHKFLTFSEFESLFNNTCAMKLT